MRKIIPINFPEEDEYLYRHVVGKKNSSKYIRGLIRKDIEGWEIRNIIEEVIGRRGVVVNSGIGGGKKEFDSMKSKFEKLVNLTNEKAP